MAYTCGYLHSKQSTVLTISYHRQLLFSTGNVGARPVGHCDMWPSRIITDYILYSCNSTSMFTITYLQQVHSKLAPDSHSLIKPVKVPVPGWELSGKGGWTPPPKFMTIGAHLWVKIGFKFQSLGKISNTSTSDPLSSFRSILTLPSLTRVLH